MIEKGDDAMCAAGIRKFPDQIASAGGMHRIIAAESAGIIERKSVVMAGGQCDISAAGIFGRRCQAVRPSGFGIEACGQCLIFLIRDG